MPQAARPRRHLPVRPGGDLRLVSAILLGDLRDAQPHAMLCSCMSVTYGEVAEAIVAHGLTSTAEITERTRAAGGCGTCRADLAMLLGARAGAHAQEST